MGSFIFKIKKQSKKVLLIFIVVALSIAGGLYLTNNSVDQYSDLMGEQEVKAESQIVEENNGLRVIAAEVDKRALQQKNSFNAVMQPGSEYAVMPRLEGELETLEVEVGDQVKKGQLLAKIDAEMYHFELEQARAQLKAAEAEFARLEGGATDEELAQVAAQVEEARISVAGARDEVGFAEDIYDERTPDDMELEQVKNELEQAKIQLELTEKEVEQAELAYQEAEDNYQRMASLFAAGAISEQQYQEIKTGREQAETQLEMAKTGLRQAEIAVDGAKSFRDMTVDLYDFRVEEERMLSQTNTQYKAAMAALEGAEAMLAEVERGPTEEDLKAAQAQVEQARIGLDMARTVYDDVEITAPAEGTIAQIEMEAGELVAPGNPLFFIINLAEVVATTNVNAQYVGLLETGESAEVNVNGLPEDDFTGRISFIPPMAGEQGGFPVEVTVPNLEGKIRAGMRGKVEFVTEEVADALVIPRDGVFARENDKGQVFVIEDDKASLQPVKLGLETDDLLEITSGLSRGEKVVLYDQARLEDGQSLEVVEYESF